MNNIRRWHGLLIALALLSSATRVNSQSIKSIENLEKATSWIDNTSVNELKAIAEWYEIKVKYENSVAQRDSLRFELGRCDSIKNALSNRQKEIQNVLSTIFNGQVGQMHKCDTTMLLRHKGLYCDSTFESMQDVLISCRRAEEVLFVKYDKESVDKARKTIELAKSIFPKEYAELDSRLEQYGALTESLRNALIKADTLDRLSPTEELSSSSTERYTRRFFDKLAENLNPNLLVPSNYPYLYGVLTKAMAVVIDDPRKNIADLIVKL